MTGPETGLAPASDRTADEDALIARWIEPATRRASPADARLLVSGVSVWVIIGFLRLAQWDEAEVAREYDVPVEAVRAAEAYYRRHKQAIDARLAANAA